MNNPSLNYLSLCRVHLCVKFFLTHVDMEPQGIDALELHVLPILVLADELALYPASPRRRSSRTGRRAGSESIEQRLDRFTSGDPLADLIGVPFVGVPCL